MTASRGLRPRGSTYDRFWAKVVVGMECWGWAAHCNPDGYGTIMHNRKADRAHRVSWELHYGPIPPGMCVLHSCDNPPCANPAHLFLGTPRDNAHDRNSKGRNNGLKTAGAVWSAQRKAAGYCPAWRRKLGLD